MTVTTPGSPAPPVICGYNTGHHMYVEASEDCNRITFNFETEVWEGEEDVEGYFEGEGVLSVGDCTGQDGCMDNLERVEGVWFAGRLEGTAYFYLSEGVEMVNMVHGVKHGVGVLFWDTKKKDVVRMTLYRNGVEVGPVWDLTMGQGVGHKTLYQPRTASVVTTLTPLDVLGRGVLYNNSVWLHPTWRQ